jgi:methylated-DNA-protein-cysteine methyltransferase-like protein
VPERSVPYDPAVHGPRVLGPGFHARVHEIVRTVPKGRVTTFGDVAAALGWRNAARRVGQALSRLPELLAAEDADTERTDPARSDTEHSQATEPTAAPVPWQRVVRSSGEVACGRQQIERLRAEGVPVSDSGRIADFRARRWQPRPLAPRAQRP